MTKKLAHCAPVPG